LCTSKDGGAQLSGSRFETFVLQSLDLLWNFNLNLMLPEDSSGCVDLQQAGFEGA